MTSLDDQHLRSGMAMKAGLRPGDYLLEINGVDVRFSHHEQVVRLIHQSADMITLKVVTIATPSSARSHAPTHYAAPTSTPAGGTLPLRRNQSIPRNHGGLPPMPPQRHPNTMLSNGGRSVDYMRESRRRWRVFPGLIISWLCFRHIEHDI